MALTLANQGVNILGTSAASIDIAEDRNKFSAMLDSLGVDQPRQVELLLSLPHPALAARRSMKLQTRAWTEVPAW